MPLDSHRLLRLSQSELDELYARSPAGPLPEGEGTGTVLILPGTLFARFLAWITRWFFWQGDIFHAAEAYARSRVSPFGIRAMTADIYKAPSRLDEKECIVMDFARSLPVPRGIRDEMREIADGLYLGRTVIGHRRTIQFALSFQYQPARKFWRRLVATAALVALALLLYLGLRLRRDEPVAYSSAEEHFKYGSLGGERESGIPYWIWMTLPKLFPEYLPGKKYVPGQEYASLGFLYEPGKTLPIGVSERNTQGIDRVFLNCAACHAGSVRATAGSARVIYTGMPSNTVDLEGFQRFIFSCAADPRFNADRLMAEMQALGANYDFLNRAIMRYYAIPMMRERLLMLKDRFRFIGWEPDQGPGRTDTFNPAKTLVNYPLEKMETRELVGLCDLPSIWLQGPRRDRDMQLHWDGNQRKMEERNLNAAFGTGAFPPTIDHPALGRVETWLLDKAPPKYPFPIDETRRAQGEKIYAATCASCHGRNGRDFAGDEVGKVTPIAQIGTDRHRLDSFTPALASTLSQVYTGYPSRFSHFRKTFGYANGPLDGIWLRAPYLHNGSVPTLRALLDPSAERPPTFYRGYDVFDQKQVGFIADVTRFTADGRNLEEPQDEHHYFFFDTRATPTGHTPRERNEGNSNAGHEGAAYGTTLTAAEKDAVVEYLKTF